MRIFHQNMQNYTGGNSMASNGIRTRNAQFDRDFARIQNALGGPSILVAGFTELLNNTTTVGAITARAAALDPTLANVVVIGVGITVIGARDEYIGIAWDSGNFTIQNGGQVLFNSVSKRWECHNTAAPLPATIPTPGFVPGRKRKADSTEAADSRGVAYVHGTYNNHDRIFAFMHNMHTVGDPTSAFSALNEMMSAIHSAVGPPATRDYVGGDYNIEPRDPTRRGALEYVCAETATGYWIDTTWFHCYDYWLTNSGPNQLPMTHPVIATTDADTHYQTLTTHASDHCGVSLEFPLGD